MKRYSRLIISICITCILIILVIYLKSQTKSSIKIGLVSTTLSGTSWWAVSSKNGALLLGEEINKKGGINGQLLQIIIKDIKRDPKEAERVARELIQEDAVAILGPSSSTPTAAIIPIVNEAKILSIGEASTAELSGNDDFFFRVEVSDDKEAPLLASLVYNRYKLKRITIVSDLLNPKFTMSYENNFKKKYEQLGGKISKFIRYDPKDNFSALDIANKIIVSKADSLLLIMRGIYAAQICQHLRIKKSKIKIFDSDWALSDPVFIKNGGRAVEKIISLTIYNPASSNEKFTKFKNKYKKRFGHDVSLAAQLGYDEMQVLYNALLESTNPQKMKKAIIKKRFFEGADGELFIIDKYGDAIRTMYLKQIKNGKVITIGKISPEELRDFTK